MEVNTAPATQPDAWFKRRWIWVLLVLVGIASAWGGYQISKKEKTMPPPLVFLIPAEYFGPVFFFFGQPDGVDVRPDPLGQAVTIPVNGVLKIKRSFDDLVPSFNDAKKPPLFWVSLDKQGNRKLLKYNSGSWQDTDGKWFDSYLDENSKLNKFPAIDGKHPYYYYGESVRDELMVFENTGCAHQEFTAKDDPKAKAPACGKFLVLSPNQYLKKPDFLWEEFAHRFSSIDALTQQANEAVVEKKAYYELP